MLPKGNRSVVDNSALGRRSQNSVSQRRVGLWGDVTEFGVSWITQSCLYYIEGRRSYILIKAISSSNLKSLEFDLPDSVQYMREARAYKWVGGRARGGRDWGAIIEGRTNTGDTSRPGTL